MSVDAQARLALSDAQFGRIRTLAKDLFGFQYGEDKRTLVARRILNASREAGRASITEFIERDLAAPTQGTAALLANHLSTNHTHFFREPRSFGVFTEETLPGWIEGLDRTGSRDLRIWCAAASTGEEPYTLAMLTMSALASRSSSWRAGVLATDISRRALATARAGSYPVDQVDRLPRQLRDRFDPPIEGHRTVCAAVRAELSFRVLNLLSPAWPFKGTFHAIFVRNVLIYFSAAQRVETLNRMVRQLEPGGWIFLGAAEVMPDGVRDIERHSPAVFRKVIR